jgi:ABC-type multidrug transport system ATPase subunit
MSLIDTPTQSPTPPADIAVETRDVSKRYGDTPALAPLTLSIPAGQRVALIGHNGSGKTTLLRMAVGLLEPSGGSVTVHGKHPSHLDARRAVSWLSDTPVFYDDLSLREHLQYIAGMHDFDDWEAEGERLAEIVGLAQRLDDLPTTFSRGLRQKAALILALIRPMQVFMVDEPFVGLDSSGKAALLGLLAEAAARNATLIVATHELGFVHEVDRIIALRDGELVFDGRPADADVEALVTPG